MLENVEVNSIKIDEYGRAFYGCKLQDLQLEAILTHFVRKSQEKGKWVTEISFDEFENSFVGMDYFCDARDFYYGIFALEQIGYLTIKRDEKNESDILMVTEKFAELCKVQAYAQ